MPPFVDNVVTHIVIGFIKIGNFFCNKIPTAFRRAFQMNRRQNPDNLPAEIHQHEMLRIHHDQELEQLRRQRELHIAEQQRERFRRADQQVEMVGWGQMLVNNNRVFPIQHQALATPPIRNANIQL